MDSGAIKRLANVDIAEARHDALVEKEELDGRGPAGQAALERVRVELERLGPERLERGPFDNPVSGHQVERTKPPGIIESETPAVVRLDEEMIVLGDLARVDPPMSRHSEMENQRISSIRVDEAVFGAATEGGHACPRQSLTEIHRESAPEIGPASFDALDPAALEDSRQTANSRLDFG